MSGLWPRPPADDRPRIMGILNITPDSFSDGGQYLDPRTALDRALEMEAQGADMIDVGAESTRPGSEPVTEAEELRRLTPVLELLMPRLRVPISVDTSKYGVMKRALELGARVINDVRGMNGDQRIPALLAERGAAVVLMHSRGAPSVMQQNTHYDDLVAEVISALRAARDRAVAAGIKRENITVDPGIGFGKSAAGNWELLRQLPRIVSELGCPVLIGLSRKAFLTTALGIERAQAGPAIAAAHLASLIGGARILRAHDIIGTLQVIEVFQQTRSLRP